MRGAAVLAALSLIVTGCGASAPPSVVAAPTMPSTPAPSPTVADGAAWERLIVAQAGDGDLGVDVVETDGALAEAWLRHGLPEPVADVDFSDHLVLMVTRGDDACPDDLIAIEVTDGQAGLEFMKPPGGCEEPYIPFIHVLAVHRGYLPDVTTVTWEDAVDGALLFDVDLPPWDGEPAPPPPEPPRAMTDAEVDAVFAGHPVQRCAPDPRFAVPPPPADPDMTEMAQQFDAQQRVNDVAREVLGDAFGNAWIDKDGVIHVAGIDHLAELQAALAEQVPDVATQVEHAAYSATELAAVQDALAPLFGRDFDGAMVQGAGYFEQVEVWVLDPNRRVLDAIAAAAGDPAMVCVGVERSGVVLDEVG